MRKASAFIVAAALLLAGCSYSREVHRRSNLMSYLYPGSMKPPLPANDTVKLQLPLRIGVAFVPPDAEGTRNYGVPRSFMPPDAESRLIDVVRKSFQGRDWVGEIVTIPSNYLEPRGGWTNLEQVAHLMNVDVIALVSVDQLQTSDPRSTSFLYISVIGAYVLPLDHNETRTMIDMAVFHVPSHTFLLRAPGVSSVTGNASAETVNAALRSKSAVGFGRAMADLSKNLDVQVSEFKTSIATGQRKDVDIVTAQGKSVRGGGAVGTADLPAIALLALIAVMTRRHVD